MRTRLDLLKSDFEYYRAGQSIFETERLMDVGYIDLDGGIVLDQFMKKNGEDVDIFDFIKPEKDDFKGLTKGLAFLKFSPDEAETLYNVIGGAINIAAGIVSIVGAVGAAADLMKKLGLFGSTASPQDIKLDQINQRTEAIYNYLANQDRRGLYLEARDWKVASIQARTEHANLRISRAPEVMRSLLDRAAELDRTILRMLDIRSGNIAFQRQAFGYRPSSFHWIDGATTPFMRRTDGGAIRYADPRQDLAGEIWDPGHYVGVLYGALKERIAIAMAIEPAFRSTGYDRAKMAVIATGLRDFVSAWRGSMFVADPAAGINNGGLLQNPHYTSAPMGIMLGAVDPVTGISNVQLWSGFSILGTRTGLPWEAWGGIYDETRAKDPAAALAAAKVEQARLTDQVVRASGIGRLARLASQFEMLASPPMGSDFVSFPDARYKRLTGPTSADEPEIRDLGSIKSFAPDPEKTYTAQRYYQEGEKSFRFQVARRAQVSRIQLGYRLRIGSTEIELCRYSVAADGASSESSFPTAPIERTLTLQARVFDCCQSRALSAAEEDAFEEEGTVRGARRLLLDPRDGKIKVALKVQFVADGSASSGHYAGTIVVTLRNLEPQHYADACALTVSVLETHTGANEKPEKVYADTMSVHIVPSYLVLAPEFFTDFDAAVVQMVSTVKGIEDRFSLNDMWAFLPKKPDPDPLFQTVRLAEEILFQTSVIDVATRQLGGVVLDEISRFRTPIQR